MSYHALREGREGVPHLAPQAAGGYHFDYLFASGIFMLT